MAPQSNSEIMQLSRKYLVNALIPREPIAVKRASGLLVEDYDGNVYTDLFAGISTNNFGHCHPEVVEAVIEQVRKFMHVSGFYYHMPEIELAKTILQHTPSNISKVFFCNSGSEAVDGSVKFAKKLALRENRTGSIVVALKGSFHGRLSLTLSLTGQRKYKNNLGNYANYPGIVHAPCPYYYRYGGGLSAREFGERCADEVADIIDHYTSGDVAGVVVEPILGEGGIIVPPDTYLPRLSKICADRAVPLIVDEVQTGFGRTGRLFACEHWGINPDIMAMAKALGAGLPLGAVAVSERVDNALEKGDHFTTFFANPVVCAASLAGLRVLMRDRLHENAAIQGEFMLKFMKELENHPKIGEVRGKGLMIGIEVVEDKESKKPSSETAEKIKLNMLKKGYLIGVGGVFKNVLRIQPPLTIDGETAVKAVHALSDSLKNL
ncbi:MAG: aspartate aminotransferase family protein [Candidatus Caldarchaeum sp.]|nr:aspartate aminotransferase family protein [Candidatus Caldarchaeum sp.]MCS7136808.1 aspartate aminotransferase family protein [Candidatus Caldarchaeum sp.]MDW7977750.1 aspartate aminotransferase family protein [Candidatus Caldarchaeum sp.]MDW8359080.1 aspartate aminotransferase family protein [Candidatus Caldarchaeum sp.]